jgi:hypothetical protein
MNMAFLARARRPAARRACATSICPLRLSGGERGFYFQRDSSTTRFVATVQCFTSTPNAQAPFGAGILDRRKWRKVKVEGECAPVRDSGTVERRSERNGAHWTGVVRT